MAELLHELFEQAVRQHPDRIAVELDSRTRGQIERLSYAEIARRARVVHSKLDPIDAECIVAILLPKASPWLHASELAILQAGGAFLCLDETFPDEHIRFILEDAQPVAILVDEQAAARLTELGIADDILTLVGESERAKEVRATPLPAPERPSWLGPNSLAYVIYTSGTTGRPKGVMIEHASIVHLLEAEQQHFELRPDDRCVQISSNAYDSALEEAWLPFVAGACVVVADEHVARLGPDLVPWLRDRRITVWMPTPTMLRATGCTHPAEELEELRLVYAGGEAITRDLVDRWAIGRRLENGYGPTECTVTVTRARLDAHAPITIGTPIGANRAHVLDESLDSVGVGVAGELCISGPCLARGYLNRPELTAERFPVHPVHGRIYRTGDLVERSESGALLYRGRIDSQVKVRGYRIELEAIEAQLAQLTEIHNAACRVQGEPGRERIVAFLVFENDDTPLESDKIRDRLQSVMPAYMVPASYARIEAIPTTVGGKIDRLRLPELQAQAQPNERARQHREPNTESEQLIARGFDRALDTRAPSIDQDFFDLGGNSLRAAELISELRAQPSLAGLTVRDVYECRTIESLAERARGRATAHAIRPVGRLERGRPISATLIQTSWLLVMVAAASGVAWLLIYVVLPWLIGQVGLEVLILCAPILTGLATAIWTPFALLAACVIKRLLIGRYRVVRAPVWGSLYVRNWIVQRCVRLVPWNVLRGTVFFNAALRCLGARIGARVHVHRGVDLLSGGWDLLVLGDDVTLSQDAVLGLVEYDDGEIVFDSIEIGSGSTLDVRAGMDGGSSLGRDAYLTALSSLDAQTHIPDGESWDGIPAARAGRAPRQPELPRARAWSTWAHGLLMLGSRTLLAVGLGAPLLLILVATLLVADVTAADALAWVYTPTGSLGIFGIVVVSTSLALVIDLILRALLLRWTADVTEGTYGRWSTTYVRIWLRTGLVESAGRWLSGSLYWRWWLRLAGMRLGRNCEISTIIDVLPERVAIGDETFFADGIYLGGPRLHRGVVAVADTRLGEASFLGNHVVVHAGSRLPPRILVGISTVADPTRIRAGTSWFGHPPIELPIREVIECDRSLTHDPTRLLYANRVAWETARFLLPCVSTIALLIWLDLATRHGLLWLPAISIAIGAAVAAVVLALKWMLLGRVRPGMHGLWSSWCCRWDLLYMAWGMLARGPIAPLTGTLLLPFYLRAMGMRIGRRVVLAGSFAQVVDPDMLTIEDGATVDPLFQAHTFEDRVLKIGPVHVARNATVRRGTVLFYGSRVGARTHVASHGVVMKNETLSDGCRYAGCPTRLS